MASTAASGRRRRPRELLLPGGRRIIVALPEEAAALRQKYASTRAAKSDAAKDATTTTTTTITTAAGYSDQEKAAGSGQHMGLHLDVDVVLHGSDEHRACLAEVQSHHARRHDALRDRFGDVVDEWASIQAELDAVTGQISRLARHPGVTLRENFSRFGYSAGLRTYGNDDADGDLEDGGTGSGGGSGSNTSGLRTPSGSALSSLTLLSGGPGDDGRRGGQTIKLLATPEIKQYFHRGLLWRSSEDTSIMSIELFFDLLYAGILVINGDQVAGEATGRALLRFLVTFLMSWTIWSQIVLLIGWFQTEDFLHRIILLFNIAILLGFTCNMTQAFSEDAAADTYPLLVAYYVTGRLFTAVYMAAVAVPLALIRGMLLVQVICILVPTGLWIASSHVAALPARIGFIVPALVLDANPMNIVLVTTFRWARRGAELQDGWQRFRACINRWFDFYPALNIEHRVERVNAFVSIVLGYGVVAVIFERNKPVPIDAFLGKAVLGLVQSYVFNWLYFDVDGANLHLHAIRRKVFWAFIWTYAHTTLILGYVLASAALSRLVLTYDCDDANPDDLAYPYQESSAAVVSSGIRFFYCHGLAVALMSMGLIAASHEHKQPDGLRMPKTARLLVRVVVCVVLLLLPLAHSLGSLSLVAVSTGLFVFILAIELFGCSCRGDSFFSGRCVRYSARCSRRALQAATRSDGEVDLVGLGNSQPHAATVQ